MDQTRSRTKRAKRVAVHFLDPMVDKITSISRAKLGYRIGALDSVTTRELNRAITLFLGLGVSSL